MRHKTHEWLWFISSVVIVVSVIAMFGVCVYSAIAPDEIITTVQPFSKIAGTAFLCGLGGLLVYAFSRGRNDLPE